VTPLARAAPRGLPEPPLVPHLTRCLFKRDSQSDTRGVSSLSRGIPKSPIVIVRTVWRHWGPGGVGLDHAPGVTTLVSPRLEISQSQFPHEPFGTVVKGPDFANGTVVKAPDLPNGTVVKPPHLPYGTAVNPPKPAFGTVRPSGLTPS
jgi:hypothetical protein